MIPLLLLLLLLPLLRANNGLMHQHLSQPQQATHLCRWLRLSTTPCISSRSRRLSGSGRSPRAAISTRCTITSAYLLMGEVKWV